MRKHRPCRPRPNHVSSDYGSPGSVTCRPLRSRDAEASRACRDTNEKHYQDATGSTCSLYSAFTLHNVLGEGQSENWSEASPWIGASLCQDYGSARGMRTPRGRAQDATANGDVCHRQQTPSYSTQYSRRGRAFAPIDIFLMTA